MNPKFKLGLYVAAVLGTLVFGILFLRAWRQASAEETPVRSATVVTGTNAPVSTNAEAAAGVAEVTPEREAVPSQMRPGVGGRGMGRVILWGLFSLGTLAGLGSLIAYDVTQYAGQRATLSLFDDRGDDVTETTYEQVEKAYSNGDFLEAVRLLREFLTENPKAVHAQIRIAEIYEKDLNNPLAAALEYEEVLQQPLEAERKGWTAIHLVNLYNRLEKPDKAVALMKRVVAECPDTPAAAKARERLEAAGIELEPPPPAEGSAPEEPGSPGLPPGFRRR